MTVPTTPSSGGEMFGGNLGQVDPGSPIGKVTRSMLAQSMAPPLTRQEVQEAEEIQKDQSCRYCGGMHARACPRVKRLAYDQTGMHVTEVEFWPWNQWPEGQVVFPEDLVAKEADDVEAGSGA